MKRKCHACDEEISENATVCFHCSSRQNKLFYFANNIIGLGTLTISVLSLLVAGVALYYSLKTEPADPKVVVQADQFNETGFSFLVANQGNLPTVIHDFDLKLSLVQGEGKHIATISFSIPPLELSPNQSKFIRVSYKNFLPNATTWEASSDKSEPFSLGFLYMAAQLGDNLDCTIDVYFPSQKYFPTNVSSSSTSANGVCVPAMKWFAKNIGPLKNGNTKEDTDP